MRLLACRLAANLHTLKSMLSPRAGFHTAGGPAKLSGGRPRPKDLAFTQPGKAPAKRSKYAWTWPLPCETNLGGSLVIPRVCSNPGSNKSFCSFKAMYFKRFQAICPNSTRVRRKQRKKAKHPSMFIPNFTWRTASAAGEVAVAAS